MNRVERHMYLYYLLKDIRNVAFDIERKCHERDEESARNARMIMELVIKARVALLGGGGE